MLLVLYWIGLQLNSNVAGELASTLVLRQCLLIGVVIAVFLARRGEMSFHLPRLATEKPLSVLSGGRYSVLRSPGHFEALHIVDTPL